MGDALLAWVFSLNPLLVWLGGGLRRHRAQTRASAPATAYDQPG